MNAEESESFIKKALKSICSTDGWSYGVFWGFDNTNSLLLTMQDAYCEEELGGVIDDMFLQVHMLGGGLIGQAAFTKKNRWMFSDSHYEGQNFVGSFGRCEASQDDSEFYHQFASGIKTIAVIPIDPHGVLQFGSTKKIKEVTEFVNQTKRVFCERTNCIELILPENSLPSLNYECDGSRGLFASLISSRDTKISGSKFQQGADCQDLMGMTCSPAIPIQSLSFTDHRKENSLLNELSRSNTYFHTSGTKSHAMVSSDLNTEFQQTPYSIAWRCGDNPLTSINHQPSELRSHASDNLLPFTPDRVVSFGNAVQYFHNPTSISSGSCPLSSEILVNQLDSTFTLDSIESRSIFEEFLEAANYSKDHCMLNRVDSFNQWVSPLRQINETDLIPLNDDLSQVTGLVSGPYIFNGAESHMIFSSKYPTNSVQSSVTSTSQSNVQEKCSSLVKVEHDPFYDLGCRPAENRDDILLPTKTAGHVNSNHDTSECISEQRVSSSFGHQKRLFSELGIKQLIEDLSGASSSDRRPSFKDLLSSTYKKMKTEISLGISDSVQIAGQPCFGKKFIQQQKEVRPKLESGSWVSDNCDVNTGNSGLQHKKHDSTARPMKKKAKPGARPRPKDRQMIQDRLSELRELIPKGEKMSIDCLLDRTIKYMLFLQSVTKHADTLKQVHDTKDNEMVQKEDYSSSTGGGVTWACEFSDQSMVCPLLVEDLRYPGQMLIEMLCEEQGFFLEIVDTVRGSGLTILKGMMEVRESKVWARFTVESEGNKHVTRQDIFSTLVQLLQLTAPNRVNVREQLGNVIDGETTGVNLYKQSVGPLPVSLAETVYHASL